MTVKSAKSESTETEVIESESVIERSIGTHERGNVCCSETRTRLDIRNDCDRLYCDDSRSNRNHSRTGSDFRRSERRLNVARLNEGRSSICSGRTVSTVHGKVVAEQNTIVVEESIVIAEAETSEKTDVPSIESNVSTESISERPDVIVESTSTNSVSSDASDCNTTSFRLRSERDDTKHQESDCQ